MRKNQDNPYIFRISDDLNIENEVEIRFLDDEILKMVAVGWDQVYFLTNENRVYSWGSGSHWALGNCDCHSSITSNHPYFIKELPRNVSFTSLTAGDKFGAVLTESGDVYTWGSGFSHIPSLLKLDKPVDQISGSQSAILLLFKDKTLGLAAAKQSPQYFDIPNEKFIQIASGDNHYIALTTEGKVYTWGTHHCCGQDMKFSSPHPLLLSEPIQKVFAGPEMIIMLDTKFQVWICSSPQNTIFDDTFNLDIKPKVIHIPSSFFHGHFIWNSTIFLGYVSFSYISQMSADKKMHFKELLVTNGSFSLFSSKYPKMLDQLVKMKRTPIVIGENYFVSLSFSTILNTLNLQCPCDVLSDIPFYFNQIPRVVFSRPNHLFTLYPDSNALLKLGLEISGSLPESDKYPGAIVLGVTEDGIPIIFHDGNYIIRRDLI